VTSVDEKYTDVDNETFTNGIAQKNLRIATAAARLLGMKPEPQWDNVADKIYLPFSVAEQRHLIFDPTVAHDRKTWMAGSLTFLTYPSLDLEMSEDVRRNDYAYALQKNAELSRELNQMMVVMLAIHAAELGEGADALRWLRHEQDHFLKPPFNVRSETPHNNATGILATGSGFLQNFLLGFTGLRVTETGLAQKYRPVLPPELQRLTLKRITFRGETFEITVERDESGQTGLHRRSLTLPSS
jgi:trehalose/maltose hydrolase-like predicted phosphorylase